MNSDHMEGLVKSLLAVDPSSEFEARIRQRVRRETIQRPARMLPVFVVSAAAALFFSLVNVRWETPRRTESVSIPTHSEAPASVARIVIKEQRKPQAVPRDEKKVSDVIPEPAAAVSERLDVVDGPLTTESLPRLQLTEFALASNHDLPQFEIRQFSLLSSNEGAGE